MISQQKAAKKRLEKLVDAAERLAAVQYLAGLHSADRSDRIKAKVDRSWQEFRLAADAVLNSTSQVPTILVRWSK